MKQINIFCFGFGQVAESFIKKIKSENLNICLSSTSTKKTCKKEIYGINFNSYFFKNDLHDIKLIQKLKESDHILVSVPPIDGIDQVIKNFSKTIEDSKPKWITYLSATSVYGDHKGRWVNEESATNPSSAKSHARLKAENSWLSFGIQKKQPIQIFRLSGIYSNKNNMLIRLKNNEVKLIDKKDHFFSRIHVEDIANVLFKSLSNFKTGEVYNISDDKPSSQKEVTSYGVKLLNLDIPEIVKIDDLQSENLKSFYKDSKKVSNQKMKNFFNYDLKFPTYVEGLNYIRNNFI